MSRISQPPILNWLVRSLAVVAVTVAFVAGAAGQALEEGRNYVLLKNPQPVDTGKNIEVIEFFSYGCPHCGELEPHLQAWLKKKPADVQLRRIPVMFQPRWENLAKIYYTLDAMGEEARLSPDIFTAIHGKGLTLWNDKDFFDWAASKGLDRKKVEELFTSFAINGKVNRAKQQAGAYNIQSVPTIIVDGKYMTGSERLQGGHAAVPAAIDFLVTKARAERPKS
jgi:thiol:disulfide interchange protein DsbA